MVGSLKHTGRPGIEVAGNSTSVFSGIRKREPLDLAGLLKPHSLLSNTFPPRRSNLLQHKATPPNSFKSHAFLWAYGAISFKLPQLLISLSVFADSSLCVAAFLDPYLVHLLVFNPLLHHWPVLQDNFWDLHLSLCLFQCLWVRESGLSYVLFSHASFISVLCFAY